MDIAELLELNDLAGEQGRRYPKKRFLFDRLHTETGKHFIGIVGPRGAGKSVILKQLLCEHDGAFYLSLDTLGERDLFAVVKHLAARYGAALFLLDEVHFHDRINEDLKKIYDFLDVRVVFTSSVALRMIGSSHDLSRRVRLVRLPPFSFREYLYFNTGASLPVLNIEQVYDRQWTPAHLRYGHLFDDYLRGGLLPLSLDEPDVFPLLRNVLETIITRDIPSAARLAVDELDRIRTLVRFVGRAEVDGINYSCLSRNLGITKYKATAYTDLLEKAFVLHRVMPRGTNVLKEPKILMALPCRLLYREYDEAVGGLREDFVIGALRAAGIEHHYLKTTRGGKTPDYAVPSDKGDLVIEVGGKGKGREQFKGFAADRKMILAHADDTAGDKRPLFMMGFLY